MSTLNVDKVDPSTGTALEIGSSGDTITVPTGAGLTVTDEVKTNKISPATGTAFALGDSGDTFTIPSGATITNSGTATGFGGGKVLQTLMATDGTKRSLTTATSFATGSNTLSVDITPSATDSKILIMVNTDFQCQNNPDTSFFTVYRDSTNVQDVQSGYSTFYSLAGAYANWAVSMNYTSPLTMIALDSPSSTSAITYQVYFKVPGASNTTSINAYSAGRIIVQEIGA